VRTPRIPTDGGPPYRLGVAVGLIGSDDDSA